MRGRHEGKEPRTPEVADAEERWESKPTGADVIDTGCTSGIAQREARMRDERIAGIGYDPVPMAALQSRENASQARGWSCSGSASG